MNGGQRNHHDWTRYGLNVLLDEQRRCPNQTRARNLTVERMIKHETFLRNLYFFALKFIQIKLTVYLQQLGSGVLDRQFPFLQTIIKTKMNEKKRTPPEWNEYFPGFHDINGAKPVWEVERSENKKDDCINIEFQLKILCHHFSPQIGDHQALTSWWLWHPDRDRIRHPSDRTQTWHNWKKLKQQFEKLRSWIASAVWTWRNKCLWDIINKNEKWIYLWMNDTSDGQ